MEDIFEVNQILSSTSKALKIFLNNKKLFPCLLVDGSVQKDFFPKNSFECFQVAKFALPGKHVLDLLSECSFGHILTIDPSQQPQDIEDLYFHLPSILKKFGKNKEFWETRVIIVDACSHGNDKQSLKELVSEHYSRSTMDFHFSNYDNLGFICQVPAPPV